MLRSVRRAVRSRAAWSLVWTRGLSSSHENVLSAYESLVRTGRLLPDASQLAAVQTLHLLQRALAARAPPPAPTATAAGAAAAPTQSGVQGAYLWGPVGSGKTMLMDVFLRTTAPQGFTVRREHLHALLTHVHERCHQLQQQLPRVVVKSRLGLPVYRYALPEEDFLVTTARGIAASCQLLAVDELHLADAADAATLGRLFGALLAEGCWLAFTSNRPAHDLYKGGINRRHLAEGFVGLCDAHLLQIKVAGGRDYRTAGKKQQSAAAAASDSSSKPDTAGGSGTAGQATAAGSAAGPRCFVGAGGTQRLEEAWQACVTSSGGREGEAEVPLKFGRRMWLPRALLVEGAAAAEGRQQQQHHSLQHPAPQQQQQQQQQEQQGPPAPRIAAAFFTFDQLCGPRGLRRGVDDGGPLSAVDMLALADGGCGGAVFLGGVPVMGPARRDEARRLVTLVDLLYDRGVEVFMSCEAPPEELFLLLLSAALEKGADPNLGRAQALPLDRLRQHVSKADSSSSSGHQGAAGEGEAAGGRKWPPSDGGREGEGSAEGLPEALLAAEEVLMWHRAASRLAEMAGSMEE